MRPVWFGTMMLASLLLISRLVLSRQHAELHAPWVAVSTDTPELIRALNWYCQHSPETLSLRSGSSCKVLAVQVSELKKRQGAETIEVHASVRIFGPDRSSEPVTTTLVLYRGIYGFFLPLLGVP